MNEVATIKKLVRDPATGKPTIQCENQTRTRDGKSEEAYRRAQHLANLAKQNYLGQKRPAEDYIQEATEQVVE